MTLRAAYERELAEAREHPAWSAYERVRDWVLDVAGGADDQSEYWREELETLDFMLDASPLMIRRLRHHTYPITGIRPYDYRRGKETHAAAYQAKLDALAALGGEPLRVPEPPALGGFGHELDSGLWNIDTLKFHEVLVALELGAALQPFREGGRPVVWEIGAGWGGFAYQFKTLFPTSTYLIVDLPELFLFSGTYLQAMFPEASIHLHGAGEVDWDTADFVLVPHTALAELDPPRLDLTVNMVSFQEMTAAQVEGYARRAHELGTPLLYSLNRERSRYNEELESVSSILDRWFWLNELQVLPVSYLKMLEKAPKKRDKRAGAPEGDYRHLLGRRRLER